MSRLSKLVRGAVERVAPLAPALAMFGPAGAGAAAGLTAAQALVGRSSAAPGRTGVQDSPQLTGMAMMLPTVQAGIFNPPGGFGAGMQRVGGMFGGMARSLIPGGAVARAAAGIVRAVSGRIRGVMLATGKFVTSKKAAVLARRVGIDAAAAALGVSAVELAEMVLSDQEQSARRRRGRGVSASDLRRARRTIRTVERMHRFIIDSCRSAHVTRRAPRAAFVPRHRHKLAVISGGKS